VYVLIVSVLMLCYAALDRAGVWCVIEDLALFIYSVQYGCKFHWLLGLYGLYLTSIPCGPTSARLPSQIIASRCYSDLDAMCSLQPSLI